MASGIIETNVRRDQLITLRKTVALSIPINVALGLCAFAVATYYGNGTTGAIWFFSSTFTNAFRLVACKLPLAELRHEKNEDDLSSDAATTRRHLILHTVLAFCSGVVWAFVPALCDWYTSPQTLFYALIVCGITAGAVTYGYSFAHVPTAFLTPPLLSSAYALGYPGGLDRSLLAVTVVLYLFALVRGARVNQGLFCNDSRQRIEATVLSAQLETTTRQAVAHARETAELASLDELTGLLNRRGFSEKAEDVLALEGGGVMLMLDLDGFKSINDAFGHHVGDRVLIEAARRLEDVVGNDGFTSRLGGDEFAIVLTDPAVASSFRFFAKKLIAAVSRPYIGIEPLTVGVSVGIYQGGRSSLDDALMYSDIALYAAKENGRNQFRIFDADLREKIGMRRDIERGLVEALAQHKLEVWYQPVVFSETGKIASLEALLRWNHPRLGWIPPMAIVSAASAIGRAPELLSFIFNEVATTIRTIADDRIRVAVNISPRELAQIDVEAIINESLAAHDVQFSSLELEITEDATIDQANVKRRLNSLSSKGVRLAIDDFGTGYSSLATLQELQISSLKIDKSFITGTRVGSTSASLVEAMVRVAEALNFEIVAEGVETRDDLQTVRQLRCSYSQGYHFSKAMPRSEALSHLDASRRRKI